MVRRSGPCKPEGMHKPSFTVVEHDEPHRRRRRQIASDHPGVRALFGHDVRTVWVTLAVVTVQLAVAGSLRLARGTWAGSGVAVFVAAALVGAVLSHWCAMAIHETTHDLAARTQSRNKLLALVANLPMIVPVAMSFRRYHLAHHGLLGVHGHDTDLPLPFERSGFIHFVLDVAQLLVERERPGARWQHERLLTLLASLFSIGKRGPGARREHRRTPLGLGPRSDGECRGERRGEINRQLYRARMRRCWPQRRLRRPRSCPLRWRYGPNWRRRDDGWHR